MGKKDLSHILQIANVCNCWTIMDEFNRIDSENIVQMHQYLEVIYAAKANKMSEAKHDADNLVFKLNPNNDLGFFITMNPGYAGRTLLPEGLEKMLFSF